MRIRPLPIALVFALVLAGCSSGTVGPTDGSSPRSPASASPPPVDAPDGPVSATYEFEDGSDGWTPDIADHTEATRPDDFVSETGVAPPGMATDPDFLHLAATNTSGDLFMYMRREVGAELTLEPDTAYRVSFTVAFASDAPSDCAGIGGAPGESVWMKVGATAEEPVPFTEGGDTRLLVDKGGQSQGGADAGVAGVIANGIPCEDAQQQEDLPYAMVMLSHTLESPVTTTPEGTVWLFVGTDAGFEGRTSLYYDRIEVRLTPTAG